MNPYKTPGEVDAEPEEKSSFNPAYVIIPLVLVAAVLLFIRMERHDAWLDNQCKPDHYHAEYKAARNLFQIECVSKEGKTRTIYYED